MTGVFISDRNEDWNYNFIYPLTSVCKSEISSACQKSNPWVLMWDFICVTNKVSCDFRCDVVFPHMTILIYKSNKWVNMQKIDNHMRKYWINRWKGKASFCPRPHFLCIICGRVYNRLFCRLDVAPCQKREASRSEQWLDSDLPLLRSRHIYTSAKSPGEHTLCQLCVCVNVYVWVVI